MRLLVRGWGLPGLTFDGASGWQDHPEDAAQLGPCWVWECGPFTHTSTFLEKETEYLGQHMSFHFA